MGRGQQQTARLQTPRVFAGSSAKVSESSEPSTICPIVPLSRCFKKGRNFGGESEKRGDAGEGVKYATVFKRVS